MATIEITATDMIVRIEGFDRLLAFKSEIRVPLTHVSSVRTAVEDARAWFHGFKAPGASVPGVVTAGTFYWNGEAAFWDVHHAEGAIAIELHDEKYKRLIIEVQDPTATIAAIQAATKR
jgi:hypothetical protein